MRGHDHTSHVQVPGQIGGMHPPRAAKRHQRRVSRIGALLHRHHPDRPLHVRLDNLEDAGSDVFHPQPEGIADAGDGASCQIEVESEGPPPKKYER